VRLVERRERRCCTAYPFVNREGHIRFTWPVDRGHGQVTQAMLALYHFQLMPIPPFASYALADTPRSV
jgi:hypothetical protein